MSIESLHVPGAGIRLDAMTASEYTQFVEASLAGYAASQVKTGLSEEKAGATSQEVHGQLLPGGFTSTDNYFFHARDLEEGQTVASLWFVMQGEPERREAFIHRIEVVQEFRGRGYGRATMQACVEKARELGAASMGLHVFGHNRVARSLYTSLGFTEVDVVMSLPLLPSDESLGVHLELT